MMIPIALRTTEELLRSVPISLREGALALGASKAAAIVTVVIPAALPGDHFRRDARLSTGCRRDCTPSIYKLQQPFLEPRLGPANGVFAGHDFYLRDRSL